MNELEQLDNKDMKVSELIKELQIIQEKSGDVEVKLYDSDGEYLEEATLELVTQSGNHFHLDLDEGCRCMSCWSKVEVPVPFVLVT